MQRQHSLLCQAFLSGTTPATTAEKVAHETKGSSRIWPISTQWMSYLLELASREVSHSPLCNRMWFLCFKTWIQKIIKNGTFSKTHIIIRCKNCKLHSFCHDNLISYETVYSQRDYKSQRESWLKLYRHSLNFDRPMVRIYAIPV
jgi:hypothetical protein